MDRFPNKQKAIDLALWRNHNHRFDDTYGVVLSIEGDYLVVPKPHPTFEDDDYEEIPLDYAKMSYKHIQQIRMDVNSLEHWEDITGLFSTTHGETLRFILSAKIPLKRIIRYELASRGYDETFKWVGFDKAQELWLK